MYILGVKMNIIYFLRVKMNKQTLSIVIVNLPCIIYLFLFYIGIRTNQNMPNAWRVESTELNHRDSVGTHLQVLRVNITLSLYYIAELCHHWHLPVDDLFEYNHIKNFIHGSFFWHFHVILIKYHNLTYFDTCL